MCVSFYIEEERGFYYYINIIRPALAYDAARRCRWLDTLTWIY